jgi:hypothetical protein
VHHIRPEPGHVLDHITEAGKGPLHVGIEEQGNAGRAVHLGTVRLSFRQGIAGRVHPDLVTAGF